MLQIVLWVLLGYFIYRFLFYFIFPLVSASRRFRRQVRDFQSRMHQPEPSPSYEQPGNKHTTHSSSGSSTAKGDYIDFEEIKN